MAGLTGIARARRRRVPPPPGLPANGAKHLGNARHLWAALPRVRGPRLPVAVPTTGLQLPRRRGDVALNKTAHLRKEHDKVIRLCPLGVAAVRAKLRLTLGSKAYCPQPWKAACSTHGFAPLAQRAGT